MKLNSKIVTLCFPARCLGCGQEISPFQPNRQGVQSLSIAGTPTQTKNSIHHRASAVDFEAAFDDHWCRDCWRQLTVNRAHQCHKCGANLNQASPFDPGCARCQGSSLRFERAVSIGNYQGLLQDLVIRMKNQHDEQIAVQLGHLLAFELIDADFFDDLNLVVPVPTHWWVRARRGFQAAEVVSETIAAGCDIPHTAQILRCLRRTKKQGTLSTPGRIENVRGAFDVRAGTRVNGLNILLVDDVMTSGATASELARVLITQGAEKVYVGVIARGAGVS